MKPRKIAPVVLLLGFVFVTAASPPIAAYGLAVYSVFLLVLATVADVRDGRSAIEDPLEVQTGFSCSGDMLLDHWQVWCAVTREQPRIDVEDAACFTIENKFLLQAKFG